ncbi:O-antigen ligase family protein [Pontibacter sp. E15-1]|uniref:O-antigen ligase family protein n=1 Tax=Pontibacter sp. E15-1 TaxID=2919918 RepID=UPI001F4F5637|nr:O-antigen ligase family protein [Pontibacter sp. E15-1]MCJ8166341.1 O-antigen ligase family protein [Pontibacter sp. E15-1]
MLLKQEHISKLAPTETVFGAASYKQLFLLLLVWLVTGITLGAVAIPVLALFALYLQNQGRHIYLFIAFFFTLILSDSRLYALSFSQDLKTVLMLLLLLPLLFAKKYTLALDFTKSFHIPFLLYISFAFFCISFSPEPFTAIQKTVSYILLFILVPVLFYSLYQTYKTYFLKAVIYLGVAVLIAGYLMYLANPMLVMYNLGGRSSGALGNPNGLGMFCFLFFLLYFVIRHYFPKLFSKKENVIILILIFSSLLWSGSRGQTISIMIFLITQFLSKKNKTVGVLISTALGLLLITIDIDIVAIANTLGFEDYLRIDTLDAGGGRVVARHFAWEQIQKNFWVGRGFGYTEWIYRQHFYELSMLGHEGNAHNAFLTVWLDTGFIGLILFIAGWGLLFLKAAQNSYLAFPIAFAIIASNMVESWLVASLNPFTIQLLMVLTLLIFIVKDKNRSEQNLNLKF